MTNYYVIQVHIYMILSTYLYPIHKEYIMTERQSELSQMTSINSGHDIELELMNEHRSDSRSDVKKEGWCLGILKKTWEKFTEIKERDPHDLDSLDMYYLNSELEDLESPPRHRPDSLAAVCRSTRFSPEEVRRLYRGFKAECPAGVVREDTFKMIYAQFFPQGANSSTYAHYVFNTLDQDRSGIISFEDFVQNLSILSRGTLEEKLRWVFSLYDINGDGRITKEEMVDIATAVYELMGKLTEPCIDEETIKDRVDYIFKNMDKNQDGVVTLEEFLEFCQSHEEVANSLNVFDTTI